MSTWYPVAEATLVIVIWAGVGLDTLPLCFDVLALFAFAAYVVNVVPPPYANIYPCIMYKLEDTDTFPASPSYSGKAGWDSAAREFVARTLFDVWNVELLWNSVDYFLGTSLTRWRSR